MMQDALSPHVKFLWVIERLQERWQGIKGGKTSICRSGGKSTPLSETRPPAQRSDSNQDMRGQQQESEPAQGLHLLSEAAMGNQQPQHLQPNGNTDPMLMAQQQQWYAQQAPQMNLPMDPTAYLYTGGTNGYDGFDYGIGMLGNAMDGAISGLFLPDAMWGFGQGDMTGSGQFQQWQ